MIRYLIFLLLISFACPAYAEPPSGTEILERVDANYDAKSRISTATMVINGRRGSRTITSKSWAQGTDKAFTQYLSPPREKDTKMLKLGDELWIWSPSADRTIKIAGHMLRQSLMGSDVSYEDFMEDPQLKNSYDVVLEGEEKIGDNDCYVLMLTAKEGASPSYHKRRIWVDRDRYLPLKQELFAKSGKPLKRFSIEETIRVGERWYPKRMVFKDLLKSGDGTIIILDSLKFDVDIPDHIFSKASLRK